MVAIVKVVVWWWWKGVGATINGLHEGGLCGIGMALCLDFMVVS